MTLLDKTTRFLAGMAKNHAHPRVISLLQHGYHLDFKFLPKLSKIPLILSEYHNKNKDGALQEVVQTMLTKKGDNSCQETHNSGILQQTISGTQTHESVATSDRFKYVKQPFTCSNIQNGNIRNYQEVDSTGGVGHLTDAYFHIPIHPQSQKYLRFQTKKGTPFWCRNSSPRVYLHCERSQTHSSGQESQNSSNIDDWLLWSPTKEQCIKDSENLVKLVQELGWLINFQKSELVPKQKLDFLGYHFDL